MFSILETGLFFPYTCYVAKLRIFFFSGTGNTASAASSLASELSGLGHETVLSDVRAPLAPISDLASQDAFVFMYPVHAFNAPAFFRRFVRSIPKLEGSRPVYIIKTAGEPFAVNSASSFSLCRMLSSRGFTPELDVLLLMPYHIMFRYPDAVAKQLYLHSMSMIRTIASFIASGQTHPPRFSFPAIMLSYLFRIQSFGAWLNGPLIHAKADLCLGCGLCASRCPASNITMEGGRPHFHNRCTMCMSCSSVCPSDAVRPGFLSGWRVNGSYDFDRLASDPSIPDDFINPQTKGYFRHFYPYIKKTSDPDGSWI